MCCPKKNFWMKQKTITPPLQVKWSVPNDLWNFNFSASWSKQNQNVFHWCLISCHYIFPTHKYIILIDLYKCIISHCENLYPFQIKNNNKQNTFDFFTWAKLGPVYALMGGPEALHFYIFAKKSSSEDLPPLLYQKRR